MLINHRGAQPIVDPTAYVAPNAVLCGDVHVGAGARILFGAVLTAEDGRVDIGDRTVVMENALVRGRRPQGLQDIGAVACSCSHYP